MSNRIGTFQKLDDNSFTGTVSTLDLPNLTATLVPVSVKTAREPDYRIYANTENGRVAIGAGWLTEAKTSGQTYVNCRFSDPSITAFYARLVQFDGEGDYALMISN